jgi:hypothetical protein
VARRLTWTPKPASTSSARKAKVELTGRHRHGCTTCSATYEDACDDPWANGRCTPHRHPERLAPIWEQNLRPQECCAASIEATPADIATYRLGGDAPWWICPTCKRPHIFKPRPTGPGETREEST